MKQIITIIVLINGLFLSSAAQAAQGQNQPNGLEKKGFGAPNKVSEEGQSGGKQARGEEQSKPGTGGGQKPQGANNKKEELTRPAVVPKGERIYNDPEVAEAIGLTRPQEIELRRVHEHAVERIAIIMRNGELTEKQKAHAIDGVRLTEMARRNEILTVEQQAKLRELHASAKEHSEAQTAKAGKGSSGRPKQGGRDSKGRPERRGGR